MENAGVYIPKWINQITGSLQIQGISILAFLRLCSTNSHSRDAPRERLLWQNNFGKHPKCKYLNRGYSSIKPLKFYLLKNTETVVGRIMLLKCVCILPLEPVNTFSYIARVLLQIWSWVKDIILDYLIWAQCNQKKVPKEAGVSEMQKGIL